MSDLKRRGRPPKFERDHVLEAAAGCFRERGYEGASIVDLTAAMNISAQSLYAAFGTKALLFEEAMDWYLSNVGVFVVRALADEPDPVDALIRVLTESAHLYAGAAPTRGCVISNSALAVAEENAGIREHAAKLRTELIDQLEAHISRGVRDCAIRKDVDVEGVARLVMSIRHGMSIQARDGATLDELLGIVRSVKPMLEQLKAA